MNTVDLSSFKNPEFNPGNPVKRAVWFFVNIMIFQSYLIPFYGIKRIILRAFGARVGKKVVIKPAVNIKYPWHLEIGDNTWIGEKVWIDNLDKVIIGANCCISQHAMILIGNHNYKLTTFNLIINPVYIEDGVWLGAYSIITGGVKCKSHSILSVGSVSSKNLEAYTIYRGNPAIEVGKREVL